MLATRLSSAISVHFIGKYKRFYFYIFWKMTQKWKIRLGMKKNHQTTNFIPAWKFLREEFQNFKKRYSLVKIYMWIIENLAFLIENHQIFRLEMTRLIKYSEYWLPPFSYFCGSMKYEWWQRLTEREKKYWFWQN